MTTKDGLHHLRMNLKDLDLKPRQLDSLAEAVSVSGLEVSLSWSHPDPSVCPSSLAKYLCEEGMEVRQTNCRVTSHVMSSVPVPTDWTEDQAEEVLHWVGGAALRLSLQPPTAPLTEGSVSCVKSSGLHSVRAVTHLLTSAYSLLRKREIKPNPPRSHLFRCCHSAQCQRKIVFVRSFKTNSLKIKTFSILGIGYYLS